MGACFSCNSSSTFKNIRVVHLNGYVEYFEQPISARQVIGYTSKSNHFLCTSTQLLSSSCSKSLDGDTHLQPGHVYLMLPYSVLQPDVSPVDLAGLAKRLTTAGAKASPPTVWSSPSRSPCRDQYGGVSVMDKGRAHCRVQSWKPILDTITEKPFHRRTESDLQEDLSC
ncbi:hypothetical protein Fmac_013120 [Flemingia macrophylla]|uniref:Uncharacterized protein n=1 Tax=Flemingia macrophylla TaxID=520843 RepID=A0ABD1MS85_9FABA